MKLPLTLAIVAAILAGCAENGGGPDAIVTPSTTEAAALFASAAENMPDRYGMKMTATRAGVELMGADAAFDQTARTAYFALRMDPSFTESAGAGMGGMSADVFESFEMYQTPEGSVVIFNQTAMLAPPDAEETFGGGEGGIGDLTDPEALLGALREDNITVQSVTTTTLRNKAAIKMDVTTVDDEGESENVTIFLFQDPTRVARVEAVLPDDEEQLGGATMVMDMLYDDEVTLAVPEGAKRALGLRYESDRNAFSFGDEGPATWTFQAAGGIALAEVQAEVGPMGEFAESEPTWVMPLTAGTKTESGVTLTFRDADGDGKVSEGDTLVIDDTNADEPVQVALKDLVSGLRIVPGAGALLVALAGLGAALAARRRA